MTGCLRNYIAAAMIFGATAAQAGAPYPTAATPQSIDRGLAKNVASNAEVSVTVVLRLRDPDGAENLLNALTTPGDPQFHKFLTPQQFVSKYGPNAADVAAVIANLKTYGLRVERATPLTLRAVGTPAKIENAFRVSLHQYEVPAQGRTASYSYHAPLAPPLAPDAVAPLILGVIGLDTKPRFRPHITQAPPALQAAYPEAQSSGAGLINTPGSLTVADFAQYYNVKPLYDADITGSGRTLGIVTLANFTPNDAFAYWARVGLTVASNRITLINIDGGPGAASDASGSIETTLDVEQSGGLAPAANMIVYLAPNSGNQPFFDAFARAINDNAADTISVSWGIWEGFDESTGFTNSLHGLLVQAAVQGQSVFAAAGDSGAYDVDSTVDVQDGGVTVDYPASDPAITAAGGTTLPGKQQHDVGRARPLVINIERERVWGWNYLTPVCRARKEDPVTCGIFPVGGGGGVSVVFELPDLSNGNQEEGRRTHPRHQGERSAASGGRHAAAGRLQGTERAGYFRQCRSHYRIFGRLHI